MIATWWAMGTGQWPEARRPRQCRRDRLPHRALKAPTLREAASRLGERARTEAWTHEEFLVACLQREVAARETHGGEGRIRAARFPGRKSLEEFDYDHARGLKRDQIAHLGTLDFITGKQNVVFLGPPGTGKTHCETGSRRASHGCHGRAVDQRDLTQTASELRQMFLVERICRDRWSAAEPERHRRAEPSACAVTAVIAASVGVGDHD